MLGRAAPPCSACESVQHKGTSGAEGAGVAVLNGDAVRCVVFSAAGRRGRSVAVEAARVHVGAVSTVPQLDYAGSLTARPATDEPAYCYNARTYPIQVCRVRKPHRSYRPRAPLALALSTFRPALR